MNIPQLPKHFLIHDVIYCEYVGIDLDGNESYKEPAVIKRVRVDDSPVFSRDAKENKIIANSVIFVDSVNSEGFPSEFKEQSKVVFNKRVLTLTKPTPEYYPESARVHHWELEVL